MTSSLPTGDFVSPSICSPGCDAGPGYELKILLPEAQAEEVEAWARRHLALDPHGDPALDGAYRTTSLYFDTPQFDVYHRSPSYKRRKFRIRRYGAGPLAYLERKTKWGDRVEKRRTAIPLEEVPLLSNPMSVVDWPGHWFHRRLIMRRLLPTCLIVYQRTAYVGQSPDGNSLRLTLDRHGHGILSSAMSLHSFEGGLPILNGKIILELKFRSAMPALFKELVAGSRLTPSPFSKYRVCRDVWGVPSAIREALNA